MKLSAVNISDLTFSYPAQPVPILSKFNLEIAKGERFGLFGPNGAGKTTLMNLMTGLLILETGSIQLLDVKINNHRKLANKLFGYVPQDFSFYQELSPAENLEFFGAWYGLSRQQIKLRTNELLTVLGLEDVRNKPVEKFSGGMKRRVNLAIGVMHNPALLFLDEPTVGVDVQTRFAIIDYLKQLNENGTTLIYTSHQLSEAEGLCERIALIDDGKIIVNDNLDALLVKHKQIGLEGLFLNLTGKNYRDV
ncbi:ABC transporter ATP-binding protein [Mucilaginibacter gilvus]|uniref:ABC transporter ATP-binding protein n=1 Tax=Mucilaginibacter gilvus TaxID=2305909 RepID=A0A3S3ULT7_9SPHI|nr:ABC transporter ATP-binding protein [Mucilaginibacter gilvus]RWY49410.1 ABC transporter ATP-binding protein [Mucilaginibacter gilvus]